MARQVFLSYSTDDTSAATTVRDHLEAQGIACWMAPRDITPGKDYGEQIINAIEEATTLLLVLSKSSNQSVFVRNEVERAVSKGKVIIPYRIQPVQPSRSLEFFISNCQWVEAWEKPLEQTLAALVQAIRNDLPAPTERVAASASPTHNLPHQLTAFVGRERELAALNRLLAEQDARLITILGPGGMGKTRLALAAAQGHLSDPRFSHGVYFVALAPLSAPQHIVPTLAEALSVSLQPSGDAQTPQQQVLEYLRPKQMLLLFDNFEHLLDGAELVAQILQTAPQVRVLATSRERLRIPGENLFPIQGLDYAYGDRGASEGGSAAVQLFTQIARQIEPQWELNEAELAQVTDICRLVGGMPLGIELAASWIELLSPAEIVAEIQRSLDFLEAERRGGQEQHRSVRAVFDSTWQRLDPTEQNGFAGLSIFRGGFTREAAEEVAGASLRLLSTLTGKSLIQHERDRGRYTIHELLRQFGDEKLRADGQTADETFERHCLYYTAFLQQQEARIKGRQHAAAVSEVETEIDNIRTAWQWAIAHHKFEPIERSEEALWTFFTTKSRYQEGATVFGLAAGALQAGGLAGQQEILLGKILSRQGAMLKDLDFYVGGANSGQSTQAVLQRSLDIFDKLGVRGERAFPLACLGDVAFYTGYGEQALQYGQEALTIFTEEHDLWKMANTLRKLAWCCSWMGKYQQAIDYYRQAIAICEESGDLRGMGSNLYLMGNTLRASGEYEEAKKAAEKGLAASTTAGNKWGIAWSMQFLGEVAWHTGDFVTARQHVEASLALFQEMGMTQTQDHPLRILGNIACSLGDFRQARSYFYPILASYLKNGTLNTTWGAADAVLGLATVLIKEDKRAQAVELLNLVLRHPLAAQETKDRAAKLLAELVPLTPDQVEMPTRSLNEIVAELLSQ